MALACEVTSAPAPSGAGMSPGQAVGRLTAPLRLCLMQQLATALPQMVTAVSAESSAGGKQSKAAQASGQQLQRRLEVAVQWLDACTTALAADAQGPGSPALRPYLSSIAPEVVDNCGAADALLPMTQPGVGLLLHPRLAAIVRQLQKLQ